MLKLSTKSHNVNKHEVWLGTKELVYVDNGDGKKHFPVITFPILDQQVELSANQIAVVDMNGQSENDPQWRLRTNDNEAFQDIQTIESLHNQITLKSEPQRNKQPSLFSSTYRYR